ncbi:MAG: helix-turn-helix domain-containing protein [Gemmataceae bacterium]
MDKLLTIKQAAELLAVSPGLVYSLCAKGKLPHLRIGVGRGCIRFAAADLEAFLASQKRQLVPPASKSTPPRKKIKLAHLSMPS